MPERTPLLSLRLRAVSFPLHPPVAPRQISIAHFDCPCYYLGTTNLEGSAGPSRHGNLCTSEVTTCSLWRCLKESGSRTTYI